MTLTNYFQLAGVIVGQATAYIGLLTLTIGFSNRHVTPYGLALFSIGTGISMPGLSVFFFENSVSEKAIDTINIAMPVIGIALAIVLYTGAKYLSQKRINNTVQKAAIKQKLWPYSGQISIRSALDVLATYEEDAVTKDDILRIRKLVTKALKHAYANDKNHPLRALEADLREACW